MYTNYTRSTLAHLTAILREHPHTRLFRMSQHDSTGGDVSRPRRHQYGNP